MRPYKQLHERTKRWRLTDAATLIAEVKIAATAYAFAMRRLVGLTPDMALDDISRCVLKPERDIEYQECNFAEDGTEFETPVLLPETMKDDALMMLYTADEDQRAEFWYACVVWLMREYGYGSLERCQVVARISLERARAAIISEANSKLY